MTISSLKIALKLLPLKKEVKNSIIKNSESIIEFGKFISDKYSITFKDAEAKIQSDLSLEINSMLNSMGNDIVLNAANKSYEYALKEGYPKAEELKTAIINLSESLSKQFS